MGFAIVLALFAPASADDTLSWLGEWGFSDVYNYAWHARRQTENVARVSEVSESGFNVLMFRILADHLGPQGAVDAVRKGREKAYAELRAMLQRDVQEARTEDKRASAAGLMVYPGMADEATLPTLDLALGDRSPLVRQTALSALLILGPPLGTVMDRVAAVAQGDPSDEVRAAALYCLGRVGKEALGQVRMLESAAKTAPPPLRLYALAALVQVTQRPEPGVADLAAALTSNGDARMRLLAASLLGTCGKLGADGAEALVRALSDKDEGVRGEAVRALGQIAAPPEVVLPALAEVVSQRGELAWDAEMAMEHVEGGSRALEEVMDKLARSRDRDDQIMSLLILQYAGDGGAVVRRLAVSALKDEDEGLRAAALAALTTMSKPPGNVVEALLAATQADGQIERRNAVLALARYGGPADRIVDALLPMLRDRDLGVQKAAAEALARYRVKEDEIGRALAKMAMDDRERCPARRAAILAIGQLGRGAPPEARTALETLEATYMGSEFEIGALSWGYWDMPQVIRQALRNTGE